MWRHMLAGLNAESRANFGGDVWKGEFQYFFYPVTVGESDEEGSASDAEEDDEEQNANVVCGKLMDAARPFCIITDLGGDDPHLYDLGSHLSAMHQIRTEQNWNSAWIMAMSCYKTSISRLGTSVLPLHHAFVIFKIQYGDINYIHEDVDRVVHWISIEKHLDFINIQWADDKQVLINRLRDVERSPVSIVREEEKLPQVRKVSELVSYLVHDMPALKNTYNVLSRNCQHFIATVYKFCTGTAPENDIISSFISSISRPIGGPILVFNCPLVLESPLPLINFQGERAEVTLSESTTDPSHCIFTANTGVCATIYSYKNQLNIFLDYSKDNISIQLLCPLVIGPDENLLADNNNLVAGEEPRRRMYCTLANREAITTNGDDSILISSIEYEESRSERSLEIFVEQPECGKPNHLFGCTKCRAHKILATF